MLEKPDLADDRLGSCLGDAYGLPIVSIDFLPLGADRHTAVYRVTTDSGAAYFLKLRLDAFNASSVTVPHLLRDQGIAQVIAPIATTGRQLWTHVAGFSAILYPFVAGRDGFEAALSPRHWVELGTTLKGIHTAVLPAGLAQSIPREDFSSPWSTLVRRFQAQVEDTVFADSIAARAAVCLRTHRAQILHLVRRVEQLGDALHPGSSPYVLCHGDIHAGNILIDAHKTLYVVDWDTLIFAPKERDLMFIGGGVGGVWRGGMEETLFYQGYGAAEIDWVALAYYRYQRIVEDIAIFCEQIFLSTAGDSDREQALRYLVSQFAPHSVLDIAYRADERLSP